jgi:hypothetical protein
MAISFVAGPAAAVPAASGNITVNIQTSKLTDDVGILVVAQHDNVVSTVPAGWNIVGALNNTTALRSFWAWKRFSADDATVVVTHAAGDAIIGQVSVFRGVRTTGDPHETQSQKANASSSTITADAITPSTANDEILFIGCIAEDGLSSTYSGTNPTFTERMDTITSLGLDASECLASGPKTDTTTTGSRTATNVRTAVNNGYLVALVAASAVAASYPLSMPSLDYLLVR